MTCGECDQRRATRNVLAVVDGDGDVRLRFNPPAPVCPTCYARAWAEARRAGLSVRTERVGADLPAPDRSRAVGGRVLPTLPTAPI